MEASQAAARLVGVARRRGFLSRICEAVGHNDARLDQKQPESNKDL